MLKYGVVGSTGTLALSCHGTVDARRVSARFEWHPQVERDEDGIGTKK